MKKLTHQNILIVRAIEKQMFEKTQQRRAQQFLRAFMDAQFHDSMGIPDKFDVILRR